MTSWLEKGMGALTGVADGVELAAGGLPLIGTAYHGGAAVGHGLAGLGELAFGSKDMGYDELANATEHVVDAVPFVGPAHEIGNLITGGGDAEHQEIKDGIEDLAGSDHHDNEPARPMSEIPADPTDLPWYMKPAQWINNAVD